jgi:hypothetical protein
MNFLLKSRKSESNKINNLITFSTCFYVLKSKFPVETYLKWINNLLSIVNNFNLVIYTDKESLNYLLRLIDTTNKKIKIIVNPLTNFYTYKYKNYWIKNHEKSNMTLHKVIDWKLNMLWNEKVFLVNETVTKGYFKTLYYGWCDIGYFRNRDNDLHTNYLKMWPNPIKLLQLSKKDVIHYGCVQNDLLELTNEIKSHYKNGLNTPPTERYNDISFAGGFFILPPNMIEYYAKIYESKLEYYFSNNYFIKDDQTIIQDIILTNPDLFHVCKEDDKRFDHWFMFQRLLL